MTFLRALTPILFKLILLVVFAAIAVFFWQLVVFAQTNTSVNIEVQIPDPDLNLQAAGGDALEITWDWDYVSVGYVPPVVDEVLTEISSDGINYNDLQTHAPGDALTSYSGLAAGSYTARVTLVDNATDPEYIIGPVVLSGVSSGGSRRHFIFFEEPEEPDEGEIRESAPSTDVLMSGLAYPGSASEVQVYYQDTLQFSITPDESGVFSYQTEQIPAGENIFTFIAIDPLGNQSMPLSKMYAIPLDQIYEMDALYLSPTIRLNKERLGQDETIEFSGYGFANGEVMLSLAGPRPAVFMANVDEEGVWSRELSGSRFFAGEHAVTATSISSDESVLSPVSRELHFLVEGESLSRCGDGTLTAPESCDDGNRVDGDGCSAECQVEEDLPDTAVSPLDQSVFDLNDVTLQYDVLAQPNGPLEQVDLFISRDGGPFESYSVPFVDGRILLDDLPDGDYEVYSLGTDVQGTTEPVPVQGDVRFTIDRLEEFYVQVEVEAQRVFLVEPNVRASLLLLQPGEAEIQEEFSIRIREQGRARVDVAGELEYERYDVVLKADGYLSKKLDNVSFAELEGLVLDFTQGGSVYILAGDVAIPQDDAVNAFDIITAFLNLYQPYVLADFNQDGLVNSFDLGMVTTKFYEFGEAEALRGIL